MQLSAYLLRPSDAKYDLAQLALEYNVPVPAYRNSLDQEEPAVALAVILPELFAKTDALIDDAGQRKLLTEIELPLVCWHAWSAPDLMWTRRESRHSPRS